MKDFNGMIYLFFSYWYFRRVEKSDSGCYLCEVNTEPKSIVYAVYLNVIGEFANFFSIS